MCVGDFNEILVHEEKVGGALRSFTQMNDFTYALADCGLLEIPFQGPLMTWSRGIGDDMILERLDRGCLIPVFWIYFLW